MPQRIITSLALPTKDLWIQVSQFHIRFSLQFRFNWDMCEIHVFINKNFSHTDSKLSWISLFLTAFCIAVETWEGIFLFQIFFVAGYVNSTPQRSIRNLLESESSRICEENILIFECQTLKLEFLDESTKLNGFFFLGTSGMV